MIDCSTGQSIAARRHQLESALARRGAMTTRFEPRDASDLTRLIADYPLAWIVSTQIADVCATPLPLLAETDSAGEVVALLGHIARSNPHFALLRSEPRATILFMGPHGYISPEGISQPAWGPTWNYAIAQFDVEIEFVPDENRAALEALVAKMETGRHDPWTIARMGARYDELARRIIAFRAHVQRTRGRFKLGQDESAATFAEIVHELGDTELSRWMRDFATTE
jgi:transcriptional regulator